MCINMYMTLVSTKASLRIMLVINCLYMPLTVIYNDEVSFKKSSLMAAAPVSFLQLRDNVLGKSIIALHVFDGANVSGRMFKKMCRRSR